MNKKPNNDYLIVLIPTFIVVITWIAVSVYRLSITSTINEQLSVQIAPIDPTFDQKAIEDIQKRTQVQPKFIAPTPAPSAEPTPGIVNTTSENDEGSISSPSIQPTPTTQPTSIPTPTPGDQGSLTTPGGTQ